MDAQALARDIELRWQRQQAVDELLSAAESGNIDLTVALSISPAVRDALQSDTGMRLEVLACFANSGSPALLADAMAAVKADPSLVRFRFGGGCILLHRACSGWNVPFIRLLLELGSNPNQVDAAGHPPLYYAGNASAGRGDSDLDTASAMINLFVRYGGDLNLAEGVKRSTPLHMAARRGGSALAQALIEHRADIEARDSNGETPLRRAVNCSQPSVARVLMMAGAEPHSRCKRGRTPRDAARTDLMRSILTSV